MPKSSFLTFVQEIFMKMPQPSVKSTLRCFLENRILLTLKFKRLISFYLNFHHKTNPIFYYIVVKRIGRLSNSYSHVVKKKIFQTRPIF